MEFWLPLELFRESQAPCRAVCRPCGFFRMMHGDVSLSSRGRGRLRGFLELRRPWGFSPEARRGLLQHHSSKASILRCSAFFMVQISHPYMTTGKTIALTRWTFVDRVTGGALPLPDESGDVTGFGRCSETLFFPGLLMSLSINMSCLQRTEKRELQRPV